MDETRIQEPADPEFNTAETAERDKIGYQIRTEFGLKEQIDARLQNINELIDQRVQEFEALLERHEVGNAMFKSVAFNEALANAVYHGNLRVGRKKDENHSWGDLAKEVIKQRLANGEAVSGNVSVDIRVFPEAVTVIIKDQGPGFNWRDIPDPTEENQRMNTNGRGCVFNEAVSWLGKRAL